MKLKAYILTFCFLLFIAFPILNSILHLLPDIQSNENRRIRPFPDTVQVANLPATLENYLTDRISIRNRMIKLCNQLNIFVFRSSPVNIQAFAGKEGWFFMSGEEIRTYTGTELFSENDLKEIGAEMIRRKKIIEQKGAKFFIAIVPNKSNIYPEFMPDHIIKTNDKGYGEQLLNHLHENGLSVIDLYAPLKKAKKQHDTYFHTDNHWNSYGGFIAANTLLKEFSKININVKPLQEKDYPVKSIKDEPGNIAKMFSIEDQIEEYDERPFPVNGFKTNETKPGKYKVTKDFVYPEEFEFTRSGNNDSLPVVLIIRDSFGKKPFPYISEQCKRCTIIFDAWQYGLNEEIIVGEQPDIVVLMIIESHLKNILDNLRKDQSVN